MRIGVETENLVIIDRPEVLEKYTVVESPQLKDSGGYLGFLKQVKRGYIEYLLENPLTDRRPYQYEIAAVMCCRRYNLMGWQQRVGKTISSLLIIYGLYSSQGGGLRKKSIHIVIPSLLASMAWLKELGRFPFFRGKYTLVRNEKELLAAETEIVIYTQDLPKCQSRVRKGKTISRVLGRMRPCLLIIDEIHGLKKGTSRTANLLYVRQRSRRVLGLTGTPTEGDLSELHHLLQFVYQKHWVYKEAGNFTKQFAKKAKLGGNYLTGARSSYNDPEKFLRQLDSEKMPKYFQLISRYIHRLNINEPQVRDCMTIPETEAHLHQVDATEYQKLEYAKYLQAHQEELIRASQGCSPQHRAEALRLINPLIRLSNSPLELETIPKVQKILEVLAGAAGKVIIYCDRVDSAWMASRMLKKTIGASQYIRVYAADPREEVPRQSDEERVRSVTKFQEDSEVKVGIFSLNLASQAIDLNQASDIIYYCLPWSSIKIQQSISRPVGPGNPHKLVKIHYLYQSGFIDEYQVLLAINKIKSSRLLLDYEIEGFDTEEEDLSPIDVIRRLLSNK